MKDYAFLVDIEQLIFDFSMFPDTDNKSSSLINKRMGKNRQWATNVFFKISLCIKERSQLTSVQKSVFGNVIGRDGG